MYDDYGNLTYVLPPKMNATTASLSTIQSNLDALGYQYVYDGRNRLVEKQVAGKEVEYIVYNKLDQPILTQDANQRVNSEWLFTLYDAFGRISYTRKDIDNPKSREELQILADAHAQQFVTQTGTATTYAGTPVYYTKDAFPGSFDQVLTIHDYDSYVDTDGLSIPSQVYGVPKATGIGTKGLSTVNKICVLGTDQWITTITGYDKKGRVIYSGEQNDYLNTTTIIQNDLDFVGKVEERKTQHRKGAGTWIVTVDKYSYDHSGRLADHYQCIGEGSSFSGCDDSTDGESFTLTEAPTETWNKTASTSITLKPGFHFIASNGKSFHGSIAEKGELIAENTYDDLGQLISKGVGNTTAQPLKTVAYQYNIRGWLKKINDPSSLGTNLFGFEIKYNDIADPTKKLYNGNISQALWNSKSANPNPPNNPVSNQYTYSYDALNRITGAVDNTTNYNVSGITYDQNGNITKLLRKGHTNESATTFGNMDNLTYGYDSGNKLLSVTDAVATPTLMKGEFKDGNKTGNDYNYDDNGNLIQDLNKGIAANGIIYNHLNLPSSITTGNGNISYIYDASGTKLQKRVTEGSSVTSITDYAGNYIYENGDLQFFSHPEGYVNAEGSGYKYVYQYKDHLGNIRLSYTNDPSNPGTPTIIEENNYYPFGLQHKGYNNVVNGTEHNWDYQGKENQKELGLNWHDFGARNYDAALGRWMNPDPLADLRYELTPYNYVQNSPMFRIDPDGLTDYTLNKKTGEVTQVGETNDEPDRILKTYTRKSKSGEVKYKKNGEAKVAIGGIEQGILEDGQNFRTDDNVIETGGDGQPSEDGVKSFTLQLSEYVGKEIKGFSYSSDGSGDVTDMVLGKYINNDRTTSYGSVTELNKKYGANFSFNNVTQQFHTHPDGKLGATQSAPGQSQDVTGLQRDKSLISNATFIILYRINSQKKPAEYDYTHEYRPQKK